MMLRGSGYSTRGALALVPLLLAACSSQNVPSGPRVQAPIAFAPSAALEKLRPPVVALRRPLGAQARASQCRQRLYASSYWLGYVDAYCVAGTRRNQVPIAQITNGIDEPEGAASDAAGNFYVANTGANTVTEYARDGTSVGFTYTAGLSAPAGVAVDGKNVYVTNIGSGSVSIFPIGVNAPSATLTGIPYPIDVAVDAKRNVYVTTYTSNFSNGVVLEYAAGSTKSDDLGIVTQAPGGIVLDDTGDIVTVDQRLPGVLVFPPGKTQPSKTFAQTMLNPISIRFEKSEKYVFVGDSVDNSVDEFSFPAGKQVDTITDGIDGPEGIALLPAAPLSPRPWSR